MYIFYAEKQELVFVYSLFVGVLLGILYDVFKIKREFFGVNKYVLFLDDVLYMLLSSVILLLGVLKVNSGKLRWYELVCPILGFVVYRLTLSKIVIRFFFFLSHLIKKLFKLIIRLLWRIIRPALYVFGKLFTFVTVIFYSFVLLYYRKQKLWEIKNKSKDIC